MYKILDVPKDVTLRRRGSTCQSRIHAVCEGPRRERCRNDGIISFEKNSIILTHTVILSRVSQMATSATCSTCTRMSWLNEKRNVLLATGFFPYRRIWRPLRNRSPFIVISSWLFLYLFWSKSARILCPRFLETYGCIWYKIFQRNYIQADRVGRATFC